MTDARPGAERLLRLAQGYLASAILRAGLELGVFDVLGQGPAGADAIAASVGADLRGTRILLDALVTARLVNREGTGRGEAEEPGLGADGKSRLGDRGEPTYSLAPIAEAHLVKGHRGYVGEVIHAYANDTLWDALGRLPDAVREGGTVLAQHAETPGHVYWGQLASSILGSAGPEPQALVQAIAGWTGGRETIDVLDVACGNGAYGYAVARHHAGARVWSLDYPEVLDVARSNAVRAGLEDRARFIPGDAFEAVLGGPYDLVVISHLLHHFSPERAGELVARMAAVLEPDGRLVIHDYVATGADPTLDPAPHLFSAILLAWTRQGQVHSLDTYRQMLAVSGLSDVVAHDVEGLPTKLLVASRAESGGGQVVDR